MVWVDVVSLSCDWLNSHQVGIGTDKFKGSLEGLLQENGPFLW